MKEPRVLVEYMLEAAALILEFTSISREEFARDIKGRLAVVKSFEVIGEAARKIPEAFRKENPQIPWSGMAGFRNRLAHEYFDIDYDMVWRIAKNELPKLLLELKKIS